MPSIFKFHPIYKERPWGGQKIAKVGTHRKVPSGKIGESWEICDREGDESLVVEGEFAGKSIRWLLDNHGDKIMGTAWPKGRRFPLLIKILDAAERLSLQVHPPASVADELNGEPKTEMWYLLAADSEAALLAGLKRGVRPEVFKKALTDQSLEPLIHRMAVSHRDAIFIPSGRIHAIDAGCLILEIQQNSDTTYRVYDWGRVGLDGKPRQLHVEQSLKCIDFNDFEPQLAKREESNGERSLASCEHFQVQSWNIDQKKSLELKKGCVVYVVSGQIEVVAKDGEATSIRTGETALLSAATYEVSPIKGRAEVVLARCG
jgi:mannose-6-phosphate isomerase